MSLRGRWAMGLLAAGMCVAAAAPWAAAQSLPAAPQPAQKPSAGDNPFPGEAAPVKPQTQSKPNAPTTTPAPAGGGDNPFPGEDSNAPIIPVDPRPGDRPEYRPDAGRDAGAGHTGGDTGWTPPARRDADPDGDPVRSPDQPGVVTDDGFSSSREGMPALPAEDDSDARPGKSVKNKTREQLIQEDLDVGGFYLEKKNWKAAQGRFTAAFGLDKENADAVWGLAESERHLQLYKEAAEHYSLFLTYDAEGPHGRAARKALNEVESAAASSGSGSKGGETSPSGPK